MGQKNHGVGFEAPCAVVGYRIKLLTKMNTPSRDRRQQPWNNYECLGGYNLCFRVAGEERVSKSSSCFEVKLPNWGIINRRFPNRNRERLKCEYLCSEHTLFRKLTKGNHSKKDTKYRENSKMKRAQAPNDIRHFKEAGVKQLGSACIQHP